MENNISDKLEILVKDKEALEKSVEQLTETIARLNTQVTLNKGAIQYIDRLLSTKSETNTAGVNKDA